MDRVIKRRGEEVIEKYKVKETKKGAYKGRSESAEWRIINKEKISASKAEWSLFGK